jgi:hypothetical protein
MEENTSNLGAPVNGDQSNNVTNPATKEGRRSKPITPKKAYELLFVSKLALEDLREFGVSDPSEYLPTIIGYIQRLIDGVTRRATTHKKNVGAIRQVIANRHNLGLTPPQVSSYRANILKQQASLLKCRKTLEVLQEQHATIVEAFKRRFVFEIKVSREDAFAERMAPSKANRTIELLTAASMNGQAENVRMLVESIQGPRNEFRERLVELLKSLDISLHNEITKHPKLLTLVVSRVVDRYQPAQQ